MTKIGTIEFNEQVLDVYGSMDRPCFRASDVAKIVDYSKENISEMLKLVEEDEKFRSIVTTLDETNMHTKHSRFVTELGLYNILSQSRKPSARLWRRIVHQQLIDARRAKDLNIEQQFDEWDDLLDTLYIDPETGVLMQSVTVEGGDVEQIPYEE